MLQTRCHCGAIEISVPRRPHILTACNCSMCRRYQPLFAYYRAGSVTVRGEAALEDYIWGKGVLRWHRCSACGCFTHHCPVGHETDPRSRWGVNLRQVADPASIERVEVKLRNGAADTWDVIDTYRIGKTTA